MSETPYDWLSAVPALQVSSETVSEGADFALPQYSALSGSTVPPTPHPNCRGPARPRRHSVSADHCRATRMVDARTCSETASRNAVPWPAYFVR